MPKINCDRPISPTNSKRIDKFTEPNDVSVRELYESDQYLIMIELVYVRRRIALGRISKVLYTFSLVYNGERYLGIKITANSALQNTLSIYRITSYPTRARGIIVTAYFVSTFNARV